MTSNLCGELISNHRVFCRVEIRLTCVAPTERAFSTFLHSFRVLTCLNPVIVLRYVKPGLGDVGNVRNEDAIVRDSKVIISETRSHATWHMAPKSVALATTTSINACPYG